jgi:hypothetical protein
MVSISARDYLLSALRRIMALLLSWPEKMKQIRHPFAQRFLLPLTFTRLGIVIAKTMRMPSKKRQSHPKSRKKCEIGLNRVSGGSGSYY